jgi:hypothetical protein
MGATEQIVLVESQRSAAQERLGSAVANLAHVRQILDETIT